MDLPKAAVQYLLPHHLLSRMVGRVARCRIPLVKNLLIDGFRRLYRIDLSSALETNPHGYPDFNSFFTRALRPDARPLAIAPDALISPVDGRISQVGGIDEDRLLQAKGIHYSLERLLGGAQWAGEFRGGNFATIYLSPRDYHRIHMPLSGRLVEMVHVPGRLFSVSPATTRVVPGLFARNERLVCLFDTPAGHMALVLVGAIFVASIETAWAGVVTPPAGREVRSWDYRNDPQAPQLERGEEMGRFNMGSTVIMLFGRGAVEWGSVCHQDAPVRMGQQLAVYHDVA